MKAYLPLCALVFGATVLTTACKDETTSFGADIMPEADKVITEQLTVKMPTKTVKTGAIERAPTIVPRKHHRPSH